MAKKDSKIKTFFVEYGPASIAGLASVIAFRIAEDVFGMPEEYFWPIILVLTLVVVLSMWKNH